ncbi:apolipoprotein(a)-like [Otolemur garnettii]|uniref:apolipoprotein(a)-like n=1 Tax=Otolemur garnettii TaxID=30611 RepID=UPI000C7F27BF|nr:apolipoprotein(a)-like [Otolemur garnettii]
MEQKEVVLLLLLVLKSVPTEQNHVVQDCYQGDGQCYRGTASTTVTGRKCQSWLSMTPHQHSRTPANYPKGGLVRNYCRNPDDSGRPWCYTTDPSVRWEYCNLTQCSEGPVPSEEAPTERAPTEQDCYEGDGHGYQGTASTTVTGRKCQSWLSMTPHQHSRTPANYPNGGLVRNYCRNPDGAGRPWCYTTDPSVRWEYCNLTQCSEGPVPSEEAPTEQAPTEQDCYQGDGHGYRGTASTTVTGRKCQSWLSMTPHKHSRTPDNYPDGGLVRNYCRNPDDSGRPWCYTTDPSIRWEYCNLTQCSETPVPSEEAPTEQAPTEQDCYKGDGHGYRGRASTTVTGRKCQSWLSMTPHKHSRTPANYPNGGLVRNYCRNPDGAGGPWCYTTDPSVRWEYCNLTQCSETPVPSEEAPTEQAPDHNPVFRKCFLSDTQSYQVEASTNFIGVSSKFKI